MTNAVQAQPAVIKSLIEKSTKIVLEDGTVSYFAVVTVNVSTRQQIKSLASLHRDGSKRSTHSASGEDYGWAAQFGTRMSTQNVCHFCFNDYTEPLKRQKEQGQ